MVAINLQGSSHKKKKSSNEKRLFYKEVIDWAGSNSDVVGSVKGVTYCNASGRSMKGSNMGHRGSVRGLVGG